MYSIELDVLSCQSLLDFSYDSHCNFIVEKWSSVYTIYIQPGWGMIHAGETLIDEKRSSDSNGDVLLGLLFCMS